MNEKMSRSSLPDAAQPSWIRNISHRDRNVLLYAAINVLAAELETMEVKTKDGVQNALAAVEIASDSSAQKPKDSNSKSNPSQVSGQSSSNYTMAVDRSHLSREVDRWMEGTGSVTTETTGVQRSRPAVVQRSTLVTDVELSLPGLWYMLAVATMPFVNIARSNQWRCSQTAIMGVMQSLASHLNTAYARLQFHLRRLAHSEVARELIASAMDVILVVYAIGFLVLSVYQAAILA